MKKILFITYMFPPIAGSGIQRSLKFIKYLPEFGIEPIVFAPQKAFWKAQDPKNLELPYLKQTKIYRCGIKKLTRYYDLRFGNGHTNHPHFYFLALKYIWFVDFFSSWFFECKKTALKIALNEKVDGIFTTSPPHSVHMFGAYLHKKLKKPWVMDLRDAMFDDPNKSLKGFSKQTNQLIEYFYEKKYYASASAITTVSQPILDSMILRHQGIPLVGKSHIITNGFDEFDYQGFRHKTEPHKRLTVTYTGAFLSQHTPKHFLTAIKKLITKNSIDPAKLLFRFIGYFDSKNISIFNQFSESIPLEVIPFQPYDQVLRYQSDSDLLLLIVSLDAEQGGNHIYTGKFFEYLGAKKPIFALVPEGPLKNTIAKGRFGMIAPPKNISVIADRFKDVYDQWLEHREIPYTGDLYLRGRFTRKRLTEKLATIFYDNLSS